MEPMMRQRWLDNLRGKTVCLVLLFHVFYYNCACCHGSNFGGFTDNQWQDAVVYVLYPWMMMLLFILAGISSRYALQKYSAKDYRRSRTLKLLVPGTIGLFVWQWTAGYFNMLTVNANSAEPFWDQMPLVVKYIMSSITGGGHLWFIQLLWIFAMFTPWLPTPKRAPKALWLYLILGFLLIWASEQTLIGATDVESPLAILNVFRPLVYLPCYLLGFYVFYEEEMMQLLDKLRWPLVIAAVVGTVLFVWMSWGQDPYSPAFLGSWYNNLYAWVVTLAMMAGFHYWRNHSWEQAWVTKLEDYVNGASYGLYILHYLAIGGLGYLLRMHTELPAWSVYTIMLIGVFTLTPALYELIRRIPFLRWAALGVKKKK